MNTYLNQLFNLEGRIAAVTGAGGHLCSEMARGFARAGCAVAVLDLRLEKAQAVEAELRAEGFDKVMALAIDVAKKEQHVAALEAILDPPPFWIFRLTSGIPYWTPSSQVPF
jgi:NAD(P)-dependent dehydrogenase (short-subunit alcohol dehydrogenase family)